METVRRSQAVNTFRNEDIYSVIPRKWERQVRLYALLVNDGDENEIVLTATVPLILTAFLSWSTSDLVCRYLAAMTMSEWNMHSLHSYGYWSMEQGDWRPRQGRGANILQSELNLDNIITSCSE